MCVGMPLLEGDGSPWHERSLRECEARSGFGLTAVRITSGDLLCASTRRNPARNAYVLSSAAVDGVGRYGGRSDSCVATEVRENAAQPSSDSISTLSINRRPPGRSTRKASFA